MGELLTVTISRKKKEDDLDYGLCKKEE